MNNYLENNKTLVCHFSLDWREGHMKKNAFVCVSVAGQRSKVKRTHLSESSLWRLGFDPMSHTYVPLTPIFRPIGFLEGLTSTNEVFLTSGFQPIGFLEGLTSTNHVFLTSGSRPIGFLEGLTSTNQVFLTSGFRPIGFLEGLTSTNQVFFTSGFQPIGFLEGLTSTNHVFFTSGFRPIGFLDCLTSTNQVILTPGFQPIGFLEGLTSTNQVILTPRFRPIGFLGPAIPFWKVLFGRGFPTKQKLFELIWWFFGNGKKSSKERKKKKRVEELESAVSSLGWREGHMKKMRLYVCVSVAGQRSKVKKTSVMNEGSPALDRTIQA